MAQKKSFLVYFDNYPMVQALPLEQRGLLLTALFEYGMAAGEPDSPSIPEILEAFPAMTEETRMACLFMCSNIHRDTQRWLGRQAAQEPTAGRWNSPLQGSKKRPGHTAETFFLVQAGL